MAQVKKWETYRVGRSIRLRLKGQPAKKAAVVAPSPALEAEPAEVEPVVVATKTSAPKAASKKKSS